MQLSLVIPILFRIPKDFESIELDSSWLPTMEDIESWLKDGVEVNDNFPQVAMAKGKMDSEKARAKQDVASRRDYISHIGIGYSMKVESLMKKYKDLDAYDISGIFRVLESIRIMLMNGRKRWAVKLAM